MTGWDLATTGAISVGSLFAAYRLVQRRSELAVLLAAMALSLMGGALMAVVGRML